MIPIFDSLKQGNFIEVEYTSSEILEYTFTDNEDRHKDNCEKMGPNWDYYDYKIEYCHNSLGYRTDEFNTIDWANSIVVFGCSMIYGEGLQHEHTLCSRLSELSGYNVVNMGVPGCSTNFTFINNLVLRKHYPTPKAVVNAHTSIDRYTLFNQQDGHVHLLDPSAKGVLEFTALNPKHLQVQALAYQLAMQMLWKEKCFYTEGSFFPSTAAKLGVSYLQYFDLARDLQHPGILTNLSAAHIILDSLARQGFK